jgi:predicted MPP superfamily phosphohydrolase
MFNVYKNKPMKTLKFLLLLLMVSFVTACTKDFLADETPLVPDNSADELKCKPQQLKIAILSDIHYLAPSLLKNGAANGTAFQTYLAYDPKLIEFSDPIFRKVILQIKRDRPDIVLIPGDLTKDGEKMSHEAVARILQQLTYSGIKVFVVPGNHDINNPEARVYNGDNESPTPTIQAHDFQRIYADFGYKNAISRDPNSLSYICQPYRGLWILGIDDCEYYKNTDKETVPGIIKPETMTWILGKLQEAKQKNITVLSMMHHGIVEHYIGQETLDPGYVTTDYATNGPLLMAAGLKVMFTGHYHANDITMLGAEGGDVLYDIETGSLVTYPSPYRMITLTDKGMDINTNWVTSIYCKMPGGVSFSDYSYGFLSAHLDGYFTYFLNAMYGVPNDEQSNYLASMIAPQFRNAMMAHYAGDESITPEEQAADDWIGANVSPLLGGALQSLWYDLPTTDNQYHIYLK